MTVSDLQYLSDEHGELKGVVVPIAVWREISSEIETQHLLKNEAMRRRLVAAMGRSGGISLDEVLQKLGMTEADLDTAGEGDETG